MSQYLYILTFSLTLLIIGFDTWKILPENTLQIIMAGCRVHLVLDSEQPLKYMQEIYLEDN